VRSGGGVSNISYLAWTPGANAHRASRQRMGVLGSVATSRQQSPRQRGWRVFWAACASGDVAAARKMALGAA